jgi:DNA-binding response OmpR family regulator/tetratricopeptide (TPR) repeat protein
MRILLVGVGASTRRTLEAHLEARGFSVEQHPRQAEVDPLGAAAVVIDLRGDPDTTVVDTWRSRGFVGLVVALARQPVDGITELLVEPFGALDVLQRIEHRVHPDVELGDRLVLEDRVVDLAARQVLFGDQVLSISPMELSLLRYLAGRPGRVVPTAELLREVWGYRDTARTRTVSTTVARLRAKIERDTRAPVHLHAAWGVGYRFEPIRQVASAVEPLTRFFGRTAELARLDALRVEGRRLVNLVGPGGVGKTRLVREWARVGAGSVLWCELAGTSTDEEVLTALATVLGTARSRDLEAAIDAALARLAGVLVLDNVEQVAAAVAARLARWTTVAPGLQFLVTSRVVLHAAGEAVVMLEPLADGGVELFRDRAAAAGAPLDDADAVEVAALVADLDAMPLALELVAPRLRVLGLGGLRRHLARGRPAPGLATAFEASWKLLEEVDQQGLAGLAVFRGPFELDAASAVLGFDALETVARLMDHSLVQRRDERFALLQIIRQQAGPRRTDSAVDGRHAAWFARWGSAELGPALRSYGRREILHDMQADRDDILAAAEHAVAHEGHDLAVDTVSAAVLAVTHLGPWSAGLALVDRALARTEVPLLTRAAWMRTAARFARSLRTPDFDARSQAALEAARETDDPAALIEGLRGRGEAHHVRGRHAEAEARYREALAVAEHLEDAKSVARCHLALAGVAHYQTRYVEAAQRFEQAVHYARTHARPRSEALAMRNLAMVRSAQGHVEEAIAWGRRAEQIAQRLDDQSLFVACASLLGSLLGNVGDIEGSEHYLRAAEGWYEHVGDRANATLMRIMLARRLRDRGDLEAAEAGCREALVVFRDIDNRRMVSFSLQMLALLRGELCSDNDVVARFEELASDLREAIALDDEDGRAATAAVARVALARLALRAGRREQAESIMQDVEPAEGEAAAELVRARLLAIRGDGEGALAAVERARGHTPALVDELDHLAMEVQVLRQLGLDDQAAEVLTHAERLAEEGGVTGYPGVMSVLRRT